MMALAVCFCSVLIVLALLVTWHVLGRVGTLEVELWNLKNLWEIHLDLHLRDDVERERNKDVQRWKDAGSYQAQH